MKRVVMHICLFVFLWALISAVYLPIYGSFFLSDDFPIIAAVQTDTKPFYSYLITNIVGERGGGIYRPVVRFSILLNERLGGLNPLGFYALNIFFHTLVSYLIGLLIYKIISKYKIFAAIISGLIFALAGNHSETVNWISSRGDLFAAFFIVSAILCHWQFRASDKYRWMHGTLIFFCLGLLSKEMAISAPLLFFIIDLLYARGLPWRAFKRWMPYIVCVFFAIVYILMRDYTTHIVLGYYNQPELRLHIEKIFSSGISIVTSNFVSGFERTKVLSYALRYSVWSYFALFGFFVVLYRAFKSEWKAYLISIGILCISALPILNLGLSAVTDESERFVYVPSIGFALLCGILGRYCAEFLYSKIAKQFVYGILLTGGLSIFLFYQGYITYEKSVIWRTAGDNARALIQDVGMFVNNPLIASGGIVILGVPDNISGAYVFRNGFFDALKMWYPAYTPDLLPSKINLRTRFGYAREDSNLVWSTLPNGTGFVTHTISGARAFYGEENSASADYEIGLKNYDKKTRSGDGVYIKFTEQFLKNMSQKPITFLAFTDGHLQEVKLGK